MQILLYVAACVQITIIYSALLSTFLTFNFRILCSIHSELENNISTVEQFKVAQCPKSVRKIL